MEATRATTQTTPCGGPLRDLEVPMINALVTCLGSEHRKMGDLLVPLASAAMRLANDPREVMAAQPAIQIWNGISQDLWSHLQIEDGLVFSWGESLHAISGTLLDTLGNERQEMRKLMAALHASSSGVKPQTAGDRSDFAQTLLALTRTLDSHVERYDGEVLPSILRTLFRE
jgi:hemerythrin-like domain-containing protein